MNKWLVLFTLAGSLLGCADGRATDDFAGATDEGDGVLRQEAAGGSGKITNLGGQCTQASDCQGSEPRCLTTLPPPLRITIEGGFCTARCKTDADCPATGGCPLGPLADLAARFLPDAGAAAAEISTCLLKCTANTDCRSGTVCQALPASPFAPATATAGAKYCMPPMPDGGIGFPGGGFPGGGMRPGGGFPGGGFPGGGTRPGN